MPGVVQPGYKNQLSQALGGVSSLSCAIPPWLLVSCIWFCFFQRLYCIPAWFISEYTLDLSLSNLSSRLFQYRCCQSSIQADLRLSKTSSAQLRSAQIAQLWLSFWSSLAEIHIWSDLLKKLRSAQISLESGNLDLMLSYYTNKLRSTKLSIV